MPKEAKVSDVAHMLNINSQNVESLVSESPEILLNNEINETVVILATASVKLQIGVSLSDPCRALCDSGSQISLITKTCAKHLKLPLLRCSYPIRGIGGATNTTRKARVSISPWFESKFVVSEDLYVIDDIPGMHPARAFDSGLTDESIQLADPQFKTPAPVQILLGARVWASIVEAGLFKHKNGALIQETRLGYIVLGQFLIEKANGAFWSLYGTAEVNAGETESRLEDILQHFLSSQEVGEAKPPRSTEQQKVEQFFVDTYYRDNEGRYVVKIPIKPNGLPLGDSRDIALRQFYQLERKLIRNPVIREKYVAFMREYQNLGHMQLATTSIADGSVSDCYHIPHHCVLDKFRVVFNASCPAAGGKSLNNIQMVGEKLQFDLQDQIMRFRRNRFAVVADIEKMFRQIKTDKSQWELQRIFWREDLKAKLKVYWLTVVTYGMASSVHNSVRAMIQCGKDYAHVYPIAAKAIEQDFYVDDCLTGGETIEETIKLVKEIDTVLLKGKFVLRHWASNSAEILKRMGKTQDTVIELKDKDEEKKVTKVLGIKWLT